MDISSQNELLKQKELAEKLSAPRFDARVLAVFLCQHHNVSNLEELLQKGAFGTRPEAWSLMRQRTIGVEIGSVKRDDGQPNKNFLFELDKDRYQQEVKCLLSPHNKETCRFLDDPRIPTENQWRHPSTGQPLPGDLNRACVYNCIMRKRWSSFPIVIDVAMGHVHSGLNALENIEAQDETFAAAGALKGGFMSITQTTQEGEDAQNAPLHSMRFGATHPEFVRTMALIHPSNIGNGIVKIPRDVCIGAKLPVFMGPPVPSDDQIKARLKKMKIGIDKPEEIERMRQKMMQDWETESKGMKKHEFFYAIPINHVMAWPLRSQEYRQAQGIELEMFRFNPRLANGKEGDPVLLYFLVPNPTFEAMMDEWQNSEKSWMGKVDMRPLDQISFSFVPFTDRARYPKISPECKALTGVVAARAYITYWVPPVGLTPEAIASLAPTLSPNFPSASDWITEGQKKDMAMDRYIKYGC